MMSISKKVFALAILLIIIIAMTTSIYIRLNRSTNVPKSATLVINQMEEY